MPLLHEPPYIAPKLRFGQECNRQNQAFNSHPLQTRPSNSTEHIISWKQIIPLLHSPGQVSILQVKGLLLFCFPISITFSLLRTKRHRSQLEAFCWLLRATPPFHDKLQSPAIHLLKLTADSNHPFPFVFSITSPKLGTFCNEPSNTYSRLKSRIVEEFEQWWVSLVLFLLPLKFSLNAAFCTCQLEPMCGAFYCNQTINQKLSWNKYIKCCRIHAGMPPHASWRYGLEDLWVPLKITDLLHTWGKWYPCAELGSRYDNTDDYRNIMILPLNHLIWTPPNDYHWFLLKRSPMHRFLLFFLQDGRSSPLPTNTFYKNEKENSTRQKYAIQNCHSVPWPMLCSRRIGQFIPREGKLCTAAHITCSQIR